MYYFTYVKLPMLYRPLYFCNGFFEINIYSQINAGISNAIFLILPRIFRNFINCPCKIWVVTVWISSKWHLMIFFFAIYKYFRMQYFAFLLLICVVGNSFGFYRSDCSCSCTGKKWLFSTLKFGLQKLFCGVFSRVKRVEKSTIQLF